MRRIIIRHWLHLGDRHVCDATFDTPDDYDAVIHIWRSDLPDHSCLFEQHMHDFKFDYQDGAILPEGELDVLASTISSFHHAGRMLIHCAECQTRSPIIGLFALSLIEQKHPLLLINDVYYAVYTQGGILANICSEPLKNIVDWYESNERRMTRMR